MSRIETLLTVAVLDTNTAMKDTNMERTKYETWRDLRRTQGELAYHLDVFGDHLATREAYKEHKGHEALQFYLIQKYHWLPSEVRGLSWEDLRFILRKKWQIGLCPTRPSLKSKTKDVAIIAASRVFRSNGRFQRESASLPPSGRAMKASDPLKAFGSVIKKALWPLT